MCVPPFIVASSVLLVTRLRGGGLSIVVVAAVAACPSAVVVVDTGGLDACSTELLVKVGDSNLKLGKVLKGNKDLCVCGSAVGGECNIGRSESFDQGAITGSGCCQVGDGFNRFILIAVIV